MCRILLILGVTLGLVACEGTPHQSGDAAVLLPDQSQSVPHDYSGDNLEQWLTWSQPSNGIVARIEYVIAPRGYDRGAVYLRLKNVGDEPRLIPAGEIAGLTWTRCFELHHWDGEQWRPMFWTGGASWQFRSEPITLELQPGESTLLGLMHGLPDALMASSHFKITMRMPSARVREIVEPVEDEVLGWSERHWVEGPLLSGFEVETPPFPVKMTEAMETQRHGQYAIPNVLPFAMSHYQRGGWTSGAMGNGPHDPVLLSDLYYGNRKRMTGLGLYPDDEVCTALEQLLNDEEQDIHWRLLIAALAAQSGSEVGQALIASTIAEGGYQETRSALAALSITLHGENPSSWVVQEAIAAIENERQIQRRPGSHTTVAELACRDYSPLVRTLGRTKCVEALPALIRRAETHGNQYSEYGTLRALGEMGDERAIPVLISILENKLASGWSGSYGDPTVLYAICDLQASEAVPMLVEHINLSGVATALGRIGDPRAIPALRPLADEGDLEAIIALCKLGDRDAFETLAGEMSNPLRSPMERTMALAQANTPPDARMIPLLLAVIRDDPSGMMVDSAISALKQHTCQEAVEGLIASFDVDFENKQGWKPASEARMYRIHIAEALAEITGQQFGNNPEAWRQWWQEAGRHDPRFE